MYSISKENDPLILSPLAIPKCDILVKGTLPCLSCILPLDPKTNLENGICNRKIYLYA